MNLTNADTLAPIVKVRRFERHERGELFVFIQQIQKKLGELDRENSSLASSQRVGKSDWMRLGDRDLL